MHRMKQEKGAATSMSNNRIWSLIGNYAVYSLNIETVLDTTQFRLLSLIKGYRTRS